MIAVALVALAAASAPAATAPGVAADVADAAVLDAPRTELRLEAGGRFGGTVGHVLAAPYAVPSPGGGLALRLRHAFDRHGYGELELGGSLGITPTELAVGYRVRGLLGIWWFDLGYVALTSDAHAGLTSLFLLPLPRAGLTHALVVRPVVVERFAWELIADVDTDLHLVFPAFGTSLATAGKLRWGWFAASLEVGVEGDVFVGWAFNSAGAAAYARLGVGGRW